MVTSRYQNRIDQRPGWRSLAKAEAMAVDAAGAGAPRWGARWPRAAPSNRLSRGPSRRGGASPSFIEASVRETIERRQARAEFIARGLAARDEARASGQYVAADVVHAELAAKLAAAREHLVGAKAAPARMVKARR